MCFRFAGWLAACSACFWYYKISVFAEIFNLNYIVTGHHVSPWGVLLLCFLWVFLKRGDIKANLQQNVPLSFFLFGAGMVILSAFIPLIPEMAVLKLLAACVGFFAVFFGRAALLPVKLLIVYALTVLMPMAVQNYLERPYATAAVGPAVLLARAVGLPVNASGQVLTVGTLSGETISVVVTAACAGPSTMAVFISIFILMMMDVKLPEKAAVGVFSFGVVGTWAQSVLRIVLIAAFGHYGGASALWRAHFWTIYFLFPLWYLIFAAIYFKVNLALQDSFQRS